MKFYDEIAKSYNELHKEEQLKKIHIILKNWHIKNQEKILDIGCGTAIYSNLFKNYIGIDSSKKMLSQSNANVIYGKAEKLPFKDKSFDVVISVTAIHNFKNSVKAINEIKRVGKNKVAITLLKKSNNFTKLKNLIRNNFEVKEFDSEKDLIFIGSIKNTK